MSYRNVGLPPVSLAGAAREAQESAEAWESVEAIERHVLERAVAQFAEWQQRRADDADGWDEHTGVSQNLVYLTREEMAAFHRAWVELITPLVRRRPLGDSVSRPAGAVPVDITLIAAPLRATESGG